MVQAKTAKEVKDYYEKRYQEEQQETMRPLIFYEQLLEQFNLKKGKKLLDVGCGTGYLLKAAEKKGLKTYGIDFSQEAVKVAKKVAPKSKISKGQAEDLKFKDNFFDYLICLGSLQYFPDMKKALKEMKRVAKDMATFFFIVPNANFILWQIKGKDKKVLWGVEGNILTLPGWQQFWQENDLRVETAVQDRWLGQQTKILADKKPLAVIKKFGLKCAWRLLPLNWAYQYLFTLKND